MGAMSSGATPSLEREGAKLLDSGGDGAQWTIQSSVGL